MKTVCFSAGPLLSDEDLASSCALLKAGHLIAIPTETVYGLAADVFHPQSIEKIFQTKKRPVDNPLIAHISSMKQLDRLVKNPSSILLRLSEHFWPGPLTLVFERSDLVPPIVSAFLPTIAVRMPKHPCARQLIEALDSPLAAPSANRSGRPSPTSVTDVLEDLDGAIAAVIDGGKCSFGIESTVIGIVEGKPVLFRPGAIDRQAIEEVIQMKVLKPAANGPVHSPGMKYRHYAPNAKVSFTTNYEQLIERQMRERIYVPESLSRENVYFHLRNADRLNYPEIVIYLDEKIISDEALLNRLEKASSIKGLSGESYGQSN